MLYVVTLWASTSDYVYSVIFYDQAKAQALVDGLDDSLWTSHGVTSINHLEVR